MPSHKIKLIFIGTNVNAAPSLELLVHLDMYEVSAVVTQPDKKVGRDQSLVSPIIRNMAAAHNLPCLQAENLIELNSVLKGLKPDFIVVCDYGQMIPQSILDIPKVACINIHFSLLPKYRGATPFQTAILNGDSETGISFFKMVQKLDAGPIYIIKREKILKEDTSETLGIRLAQEAAILLIDLLPEIKHGVITPLPQDHSKASYCHKFTREDGKIDFINKTAEEIFNQIRAFTPWPSSFFVWNNKRLKILEADYCRSLEFKEVPLGKIIDFDGKIAIKCKKDLLILKSIQLEGKNVMKIEEFIRGRKEFLNAELS